MTPGLGGGVAPPLQTPPSPSAPGPVPRIRPGRGARRFPPPTFGERPLAPTDCALSQPGAAAARQSPAPAAPTPFTPLPPYRAWPGGEKVGKAGPGSWRGPGPARPLVSAWLAGWRVIDGGRGGRRIPGAARAGEEAAGGGGLCCPGKVGRAAGRVRKSFISSLGRLGEGRTWRGGGNLIWTSRDSGGSACLNLSPSGIFASDPKQRGPEVTAPSSAWSDPEQDTPARLSETGDFLANMSGASSPHPRPSQSSDQTYCPFTRK